MASYTKPGRVPGQKGPMRPKLGETAAKRPMERAVLARRPLPAGGVSIESRKRITTQVLGADLRGTLAKALDHMDANRVYRGPISHRSIFESRFGINDGVARTREEVAELHKTTPAEVMRIEDAFFMHMIDGPHGPEILRHLANASKRPR